MFKAFLVAVFIYVNVIFAGWGKAPTGWGDFDFGLLDGKRDPFSSALSAALTANIQIDHRYVYITTLSDIEGFLFASWYNYATDGPKGIRPSITIYMLQQGQDAPDGSSALNSAADATFMKTYFEGIAKIASECNGKKPIFVIEPDVWGYLLGQANPSLTDANLSKICHINDLGLSWLSEFENRMDNLPAAIIKTLKLNAPDCYAGILMAHWGFPDDLTGAIADGKLSGQYINKFLKDPYRGDFMGIEKNGTDAGSWGPSSSYHWNDTKNAAFLGWCKALGQETNLPLFGWQISIGYKDEVGYDALPNTSGRYTDTFFPYFFKHTQEWLDAGLIGFDAACNNQGFGTWYAMKSGEGDNGWFLDQLKVFNQSRPYNLNLDTTAVQNNLAVQENLNKTNAVIQNGFLKLNPDAFTKGEHLVINAYSVAGKRVKTLYSGVFSDTRYSINLSKASLTPGMYVIKISSAGVTSSVEFMHTK